MLADLLCPVIKHFLWGRGDGRRFSWWWAKGECLPLKPVNSADNLTVYSPKLMRIFEWAPEFILLPHLIEHFERFKDPISRLTFISAHKTEMPIFLSIPFNWQQLAFGLIDDFKPYPTPSFWNSNTYRLFYLRRAWLNK